VEDSADATAPITPVDVSLTALSDATIKTVAVAASISIAAGGTSNFAIAGGGAVAINTILGQTNAFIDNSTLGDLDDLSLLSDTTSTITATVVAVAASVAGGGNLGASAAIGAAIARNDIGYDADGNRVPVEAMAYIHQTDVDITGDLTLQARSTAEIEARVGSGAVAIAASKGTGVGLSGSGVESTNRIATLIHAYVDGGSSVATVNAANVTITADDTSGITANAGAASIAVSVASKVAVSLAIGVALADNEISNEVEAYVANATVDTVDGNGTTAGDIVIAANTNQPTLFDLPGNFDTNLATAIAHLDDAATTDDDNVDFDADVVFKKDLRQAFADAGETLRATSYTISVVMADAYSPIAITKGLKVADGSGNVYEYISDTDGGTLQTTQVFTNRSLWREVDDLTVTIIEAGHQWSVYDGENTYLLKKVVNDGGNEVLRIFDATIETVAVAASIAAGFSSTTGVGLSGAGADATNTILTQTNAFVRDSHLTSDGNVTLDANNASGIVATIASVSVAAGIGTGTAGVGASIGVSIARNRIGQAVEALTLDDLKALPDVLTVAGQALYTTGSGAIVLKQGDFVRIEAGPGAGEIYQYLGEDLTDALDLRLVDYQSENWRIANLNTDQPGEVLAYLQDSSVNAAGDLSLSAISAATIQAGVGAGSMAIGGGSTVGVGLSGVGVSSRNDINTLVKAFISGDGATGITANAITANANDLSTISVDTAAASFAGTVGGTAAVAISIGVALAKNEISNLVEASISHADNGVIARNGHLILDAAKQRPSMPSPWPRP
jgi:hypothetical protein